MRPPIRGPLPDEVLPVLARFAHSLTPDLFEIGEAKGPVPAGQKEQLVSVRAAPVAAPGPIPSLLDPPSLAEIKTRVLPAPGRSAPTARRTGRRIAAASAVAAAIALVATHLPAPRIVAPSLAPSATASLPPELAPAQPAAPSVEALHWQTLREAFDRIGFDLDAVAAGSMPVPRVMLVTLPLDIEGISDLDARKDLFLRAFLPIVLTVDERIAQQRVRLVSLRDKMAAGVTLADDEVTWLLALGDTYDQPDCDVEALLRKVDVIPPSIALAQAIQESGWGTSRIAKDQNAMFGQFGTDDLGEWDYRAYTSLTAAVESYARNLNTNRAYKEFRMARARMRQKGDSVDAWTLAATLFRYSERRADYVHSLRWIIRDNGLRAFDSAQLGGISSIAVIASNDDARDVGPISP